MQGVVTAARSASIQTRRRWPALAMRVLWFAVLVLSVESLLVSVAPGYALLSNVCSEPVCDPLQMTPVGAQALADLGWSVRGYAVFQLILVFLIAIVYGVVSIMIFRARPNDPFALFVAVTLLLFGTFMSEHITVIGSVHPALKYVATFAPLIGLISLAILFYLFPDGRFVPRWTRWAAVGWVAVPVTVVLSAIFWEYTSTVEFMIAVALLALAATCLIAPIYRYVKVANRIQRQQTKWVMVGFLQLLAVMVGFVELLPRFMPMVDVTGTLPNTLNNLLQVVSLTIMPVTIGLALLRYRLWDVDLIINRSLVYVPLTSILAAIYTTSLTVSQKLFTTISGEQSPSVIIFTSFILITTFTPIRNWLQTVVDHYFKEPPDPLKPLKELDSRVTEVTQILDRRALARRVVMHAVAGYRAAGGALYWQNGAQLQLVYATPNWHDEQAAVTLPLVWEEQPMGRLLLGPKPDGDDYDPDECAALQQTVTSITQALRVVPQEL
jgi:hypothetical protein